MVRAGCCCYHTTYNMSKCNIVLMTDFRGRYWILAQAEINSSRDDKTAVYAMMDKIREIDR